MYESSWGVFEGEQPPFLYLDWGKNPPPNEREATVEVCCQAFGGKTKVINIHPFVNTLGNITWTLLIIWEQYGARDGNMGGGSVSTSSEAKPSLTHSRDSWETHPTSKQTNRMRMTVQSSSILIVSQRPTHMRHGDMMFWSICTDMLKYYINPCCNSSLNPVSGSQ